MIYSSFGGDWVLGQSVLNLNLYPNTFLLHDLKKMFLTHLSLLFFLSVNTSCGTYRVKSNLILTSFLHSASHYNHLCTSLIPQLLVIWAQLLSFSDILNLCSISIDLIDVNKKKLSQCWSSAEEFWFYHKVTAILYSTVCLFPNLCYMVYFC